MNHIIQETVEILETLPEFQQELVNQFIKRLVTIWETDLEQLSSEEREQFEERNIDCSKL